MTKYFGTQKWPKNLKGKNKFEYLFILLVGNIVINYRLQIIVKLLFFRFYMECLLPEIVDPLYGRRFEIMDIREPKYIKEA